MEQGDETAKLAIGMTFVVVFSGCTQDLQTHL
jgi:hypothetical protein